MNNNVIQNIRRRQHEPPVKGKRSPAAAASPAGFLVPDGNTRIAAPDDVRKSSGIVSCPFRNRIRSSGAAAFFYSGAFCFRISGDRQVRPGFLSLLLLGQLGSNPKLFFCQQTDNLCIMDKKRDADGQESVLIKGKRTGFPAAAYDFIIHGKGYGIFCL